MIESVKAVFDSYPVKARKRLLSIRKMILDIAASDDVIGELEETLKWGEPSYLTNQTRSGSTVRIAWKEKQPDQIAIYLNCQTTLVDTFRTIYPDLKYEGNRAIAIALETPLPEPQLRHCLQMALTYHLSKKKQKTKSG